MAEAAGRRNDETSSPSSQRRGPESWTLAIIIAVIVLAAIGLLAFMGMGS
ncbi:hypothetical protein [Phenylobacterium deserti]|nr:hypothetical protein [Phenylobacterium deserti]